VQGAVSSEGAGWIHEECNKGTYHDPVAAQVVDLDFDRTQLSAKGGLQVGSLPSVISGALEAVRVPEEPLIVAGFAAAVDFTVRDGWYGGLKGEYALVGGRW